MQFPHHFSQIISSTIFAIVLFFLFPRICITPPLFATEPAEQKAGEVLEFELNGEKWRFHWCPAGSFMMGSPSSEEGRYDSETQHRVILTPGFWMSETEVTQEQWEAVMGNNPSRFKGGNQPVEMVSWNDCQEFVNKLNKLLAIVPIYSKDYRFSLPTEAQWEYACRAGSTTAYNFGDDAPSLSDYAWFKENAGDTTHPVGTKKPNAWGLYDMHGNVWEMCLDWYDEYNVWKIVNPTGAPSEGIRGGRVNRGGARNRVAEQCRSACRDNSLTQKVRLMNVGVRISLVPYYTIPIKD